MYDRHKTNPEGLTRNLCVNMPMVHPMVHKALQPYWFRIALSLGCDCRIVSRSCVRCCASGSHFPPHHLGSSRYYSRDVGLHFLHVALTLGVFGHDVVPCNGTLCAWAETLSSMVQRWGEYISPRLHRYTVGAMCGTRPPHSEWSRAATSALVRGPFPIPIALLGPTSHVAAFNLYR